MNQDRSGPTGWQYLFYLPAAGAILLLGCGIAYCAQNMSGHFSLDPLDGGVVFGPILVVGLGLRFRGHRQAGRVSVVVGLLGIGFGYSVRQLGVMQDYHGWLASGLQPKHPLSGWLLTFYGVFSVIALVLAIKGGKGRRSDRIDDLRLMIDEV